MKSSSPIALKPAAQCGVYFVKLYEKKAQFAPQVLAREASANKK
jgi:hypothetical protein